METRYPLVLAVFLADEKRRLFTSVQLLLDVVLLATL